MRFHILLILVCLLSMSSCSSSWKYYKAKDSKVRRSQSVGLTTGRFFRDKETACVAVRVYNWRDKELTVSRDNFILTAGSAVLTPLSTSGAKGRDAYKKGYKMYGRGASDFYCNDSLKIVSKKSTTKYVCFDLEGNDGPFTLALRNLQVGGKDVNMKSIDFQELKRK